MFGGMMLLWVLLIVVIVWVVVRGIPEWTAGGGAAERGTPLEILERRYAEGEISTEEYEERKARLKDEV